MSVGAVCAHSANHAARIHSYKVSAYTRAKSLAPGRYSRTLSRRYLICACVRVSQWSHVQSPARWWFNELAEAFIMTGGYTGRVAHTKP